MSDEKYPAPKYPDSKYAVYVAGVLLVAYSVSYVDRQILSLMVGPIQRDLGINDTQMSLLQGFAFALFYTSIGLFFGRAADHRNRRNLMIAGVTVWSLATAAGGLATGFATLFLARVFVGVGEATLSPSAYSMLADYFAPERRARAVGFYSLGVYIGSALAFIVGGIVIEATQGSGSWKMAFFIVSIPGFLVALLMMTVKEPKRINQTKKVEQDISFLRERKRIYIPLILGYSILSIVTLALMAWTPTMFIRRWGWTPRDIGVTYGSLILVFGLSGMMLSGFLADRKTANDSVDGAFKISLWGSIALIPSTAFLLTAPSAKAALIALACITFFLGFPIALAPTVYNSITPNRLRGQVIALYLLANNIIGMSLGPTAVAFMTNYYFKDELKIGSSLGVVCLVASMLGVLSLLIAKRHYEAELIKS